MDRASSPKLEAESRPLVSIAQKHVSGSAEIPGSYEAWRVQFIGQRLRVLYLVGLIVNPIFSGLDLLAHSDHLGQVLTLRVILEVGLLLGFLALRLQLTHLKAQVLLAYWPLIPNILIAHMILTLGPDNSTYYNGLGLVLLTAAVIVPVCWLSHFVAQAGSLVYYYGALALSGVQVQNVSLLIESAYFLVFTCVALQISVILYERLQRAEFRARLSEQRAREELESSNKKLLELDRLKSEFFANISHEFRTPLTLALGAYKALLHAPLSIEDREIAGAGLRNVTRLLFLINELLDLAKFDTGRAELRKRTIDLTALVRTVVSNFESGSDRRIILSGLGERVLIEADQRQIKKVLYNLLSNAFKFSDQAKGRVEVSLITGQDHSELVVRDNGIGIPADQLDRIFERFTQVEGSAARRYEGSGIGLALVKEIVALHAGRITAESEVGQGSTFRVILPIGTVDPMDIADSEEEEMEVAALPGTRTATEDRVDATEAPSAERKSLVLVAEDHADMRHYLRRVLGPQFRVTMAIDGVDALTKVRQLRPDLILTDVMMPQMSGYDLLKAVRGDAALRSVPVIFLTARTGTEARVESLEAGADDYISKPFSEEELLARMKNQLRIRRQEQELESRTVELHGLNRQLEAVNERLRELDQRKSEFVSIVAHELRTPLSSIRGYAENMLEGLGGVLTDKQQYYLGRITFNVERLTRMITELLDLARIEAGQIGIRCEPLAIADCVETIIEGLQTLARDKTLTVRAVHAPHPLMVRGDPDKLTQVLTNLIHNAVKFTPAGGDILVEVHDPNDGCVQICVADTGCGIPPSEVSQVFDKFYRGSSLSSEGRGAGLGLAIVKHLVELQGGRIWVQSTPGKGSRFYFTLPIVHAEPVL
jgi:signal transduction histidine kinase